jgi:hypothetical protein
MNLQLSKEAENKSCSRNGRIPDKNASCVLYSTAGMARRIIDQKKTTRVNQDEYFSHEKRV